MNFLAEVLSSAEQVELDEINKKVPELRTTIEDIKSEVIRYIENVYVKYSGRPKQNRFLLSKAHEIEDEIKTLKNNAEHATKKELLVSSHELQKNIALIEGIHFSIHVVSNLCQINELLIKFTELLNSKMYLECMKLISNLEELANQVPDDEYMEIIDELKIAIDTKKDMLLNQLKNVFTDNISILENNEQKCVTVNIKKENNALEQALLALYYKNSVIYPLHCFAKSLWNNILVPIVDSTVQIDAGHNDQFYILKVMLVGSRKSDYRNVFSNLKVVLQFLKNHFNLKISEELTTLGYIGLDIKDNLSEIIIKNCLQATIPSTAEELQLYKVVIEETKLLEVALKDCKIFTEDTASIFEYANNVDILFINKKCQEYLVMSQTIMKKDLHDMVEVGTPYNPDNPLGCSVDEFLHCSVSKSVLELLQFTEKIIQQALAASDDVCAGRLICTVQNIFRKYSNFVPEYHKKLLQTIPQQIALFHNNCFYIAYELTRWNQNYSPKLSLILNTENCGFIDEVSQLQIVASEVFTTYVEGQVKQIQEIMKEALLEGPTLEKLEPITEKCIRQCLRQQELLRTVWHKVLSYPIYNKTIGVILNSLCNNIINSVVKFEDISCDAAEQLVEIFKIILNRGPKLFTDSKEISLYVSSWYKLNELNFVLGASLLDINDRWADGKGPIALQFKPIELKQLIRALFQNTDKRSAVLAKIQD